jgi:hypothetical protein
MTHVSAASWPSGARGRRRACCHSTCAQALHACGNALHPPLVAHSEPAMHGLLSDSVPACPWCRPPPPPSLCCATTCSLSFDCPNLVQALHYARIRINPNSPEASLVRRGCVCTWRACACPCSSCAARTCMHCCLARLTRQLARLTIVQATAVASGATRSPCRACPGLCPASLSSCCACCWARARLPPRGRIAACRARRQRPARAASSCRRALWASLSCRPRGPSSSVPAQRGRGP